MTSFDARNICVGRSQALAESTSRTRRARLVRVKGFSIKALPSSSRFAVLLDEPLGVARCIEYLDIRTVLTDSACQVQTTHAGHDEVCQEQVNGLGETLCQFTRLQSIRSIYNIVSVELQCFPHQSTNPGLIFYHQDGLGSVKPVVGFRVRPSIHTLGLIDPREINLERRTFLELAVRPNVAAALFDYSVDRRQTQTGATDASCKERIEGPAAVFSESMPTPVSLTANMT